MRPSYDPPYESPIEDLFALNIVKYLEESVQFQKQVDCRTVCGNFRIDFVCLAGKGIGIECDGKDYHDEDRDEWRDAMILGDHCVDTIYRFRGQDLNYHMEDVLWIFSQYEPWLFSERGRCNLDLLASENIKQGFSKEYGEMIVMPTKWEGHPDGHVVIFRRTNEIPPGMRAHWTYLYKRALEFQGHDLDGVREQYKRKYLSKLEGTNIPEPSS